jgi:plasmid stabilization system protein ParE
VRRIVFTQAARAELIEAQDWYEREAPGLGRRFRTEIDAVVRRMADNPLQFPVRFKTLRRARVRKFPYGLFFTIKGDVLLVVACFHGSRDPKRWQERT